MSELPAGDCGACIWSGEGDAPAFFEETNPRARRDYSCCECGERIVTGEIHNRAAGKWDGEVQSYRTCACCAEIRRVLCCEGWTYTTLWTDAAESIFEYLTVGCLAKLETAAAKEKLLARWRAWKFAA